MSEFEVYPEPTPNPNAVKFSTNRQLTEGRSRSYNSREEADVDALARAIFAVPGVKAVFILNNFITVSKEWEGDWSNMVGPVEEAIRKHFG